MSHLRAQKGQALAPSFYDVSPDSELYEPVAWAYRNGIVSGTTDTTFSPNDSLTREQVCTLLARFGALEGVQLARVVEPDQFKDSIYVSEYARSGVTACQMAGIIKGYANGFLYPSQVMSKQECAATLYRIYLAATSTLPEGTETVDLTAGAYDSLYDSYTDIPFTALVPAGAEAPQGYFDHTVFIGDSISLMLKAYCASTGALGQAQFLCAGSMSATNMLTGQILPEWPAGSGQKPTIQQSVAATGASVVYIMLGMDNMGYLGTDRALSDLAKIVANIKEAAPNVTIVMQSVTPMADSSTSYSSTLNNDVIDEYNTKLQALCQEQRWYYLNVSEVFKNENGFLIKDYCSDYGKMGMHYNYKGNISSAVCSVPFRSSPSAPADSPTRPRRSTRPSPPSGSCPAARARRCPTPSPRPSRRAIRSTAPGSPTRCSSATPSPSCSRCTTGPMARSATRPSCAL